MTILKKLVVKTGTYEKDGETKNRYKTIGHMHSGQHGEYITLDASVNLAAFPRKAGDDRVMVSMWDEEERQPQRQKRSPDRAPAKTADEGFDDDIPF